MGGWPGGCVHVQTDLLRVESVRASHWDDRVCIRSCMCMFIICLFLRWYALYVCLHSIPFSPSSQHVQDAWYEDGFQLEECCCKVCAAHGVVRTSCVSLEFLYWYVFWLSLSLYSYSQNDRTGL